MMSSLHAVHIEIPGFEIDLLPPQGHQLRRAQSMAKHHENNRRIAHPVASGLACCLYHRVHFVGSKIVSQGIIASFFPGGAGRGSSLDFAENERWAGGTDIS